MPAATLILGRQYCILAEPVQWFSVFASRAAVVRAAPLCPPGRRFLTSEAGIVKSEKLTLQKAILGLRQASTGPQLRLPRSVQATYLRPLKRSAKYGVPVCDLQLRSYSVRNLEFMTDFAMRAAYFLGLPTSGPLPLPQLTERWTVSKSAFVHKKTQENFERKTLRRLIQIQDGNIDSVHLWLSVLRKYAYHGVGMKANVWENEKIDVANEMDTKAEALKEMTDATWDRLGRRRGPPSTTELIGMIKASQFRE